MRQIPRLAIPAALSAAAGFALTLQFERSVSAASPVPVVWDEAALAEWATLAEGFSPPKDVPATLDVMPISVGTDPGLALATRKGTGYYKVPSLKGVWYRGHYLHDGSAATLEEMFDPERLKDTHKPGGWSPPGASTRAIKGHEFGLHLPPQEREQLIAFLRTL
jgi:cytochrome c peroxidase